MIGLTLTRRTYTRAVVMGSAAIVAGILALSPDAGLPIRVVAAGAFIWAAFWVLDLVGPLRLWRGRPGHYEIPTLLSRQRVIEVEPHIEVSTESRGSPAILIRGDGTRRVVRVNPLLSSADLADWLSRIAPPR